MPNVLPKVFVLDKKKRPLMPCHPARARELLRKGRAAVHRLVPFTIRMKDRIGGDVQPVRVCKDPGSKVTGIAVVREVPAASDALVLNEAGDDVSGPTRVVLYKIELEHRGNVVHAKMEARASRRRGRRERKTRYRQPRFSNRRRVKGWLGPSLRTRVDSCGTWLDRLRALVPVSAVSMELVKFDTQKMQDQNVSGVGYQRGTLYGCDVRGYVMAKWEHACAYCGARDVPLTMDHVVPRASHGSDRPSNLVAACIPCNERKGSKPVEVFLKGKPDVLKRVLAQLKTPLRDAAAVTTTRWALHTRLKATGLPVTVGTGSRTAWNRKRFGVAKTHANDAVCVGKVGAVIGHEMRPLYVRCTGRGDYCRTLVDAYGFFRAKLPRAKNVRGFRTGDLVRAIVPEGVSKGTHVGRVAVRTSGSFAITTATKREGGVSHKHCRVLQRADGYGYRWTEHVRVKKAVLGGGD